MLRALFDFLGGLGEGGIVALVIGLMVLVVIVPMLWSLVSMAHGG